MEYVCQLESAQQLHLAIDQGQIEKAKTLIKKGVDIEKRNHWTRPPLLCAADKGQTEIVTALLKVGANLIATDGYDRTALHFAAERGYLSIIQLLIAQHPSSIAVTALDSEGRTPLHWASMRENPAVIGALIQAGANINATDNAGRIPMHFAAMFNNPKLAHALLSHGSYKDFRDHTNRTPLYYAVSKGNQEITSYLLERGCDVFMQSNNVQQSVLHVALNHFQLDTLACLLNQYPRLLDIHDCAYGGIKELLLIHMLCHNSMLIGQNVKERLFNIAILISYYRANVLHKAAEQKLLIEAQFKGEIHHRMIQWEARNFIVNKIKTHFNLEFELFTTPKAKFAYPLLIDLFARLKSEVFYNILILPSHQYNSSAKDENKVLSKNIPNEIMSHILTYLVKSLMSEPENYKTGALTLYPKISIAQSQKMIKAKDVSRWLEGIPFFIKNLRAKKFNIHQDNLKTSMHNLANTLLSYQFEFSK